MVELSLAGGAGVEIGSLDDLDRYLEAVGGAGFRNVSLALAQMGADPLAAADLLSRRGMRCPDVLSLMVSRDEEQTLEGAARLARAAGEVGAQHVLSLVMARVTEEVVDRYGRCADIVAASGARLALEMPPIGELNSISAALSFLEAVGGGRAGLMIDTYHFSRGTSTWEELESFPLDVLAYVQFDDALAAVSEDAMYETMQRRAFPGDGEFDLTRFCDVLTGRGWSGLVSVEVLSEELRRLEVSEFARRAYTTTAAYWDVPAPDRAS